jgi:hypothetical protein
MNDNEEYTSPFRRLQVNGPPPLHRPVHYNAGDEWKRAATSPRRAITLSDLRAMAQEIADDLKKS